jgi:hypothetical protein
VPKVRPDVELTEQPEDVEQREHLPLVQVARLALPLE